MKQLFWIFLTLLVSGILLTSCGDDDEGDISQELLSIVETAQNTDDLSILVDALIQTDLVGTLEGSGPFTVFAPTNEAFQNLLNTNPDWNSLSDIDNDLLTTVLLFHVLGAEVASTDLTDSYVTTAATGPNEEQLTLQIDVTGGVLFNGSTAPVTTDVEATNGVIHIVDEVMLPPNVVDFAINNDNFSSLVAALTRNDLTTDYVSVLTGEGPFTVFAPTNQAFQNLLDSNAEWNELGDIPVSTLEAVLNYHVVSGLNVQSDELTDDQTVATLGGNLTVDLSNGASIETSSDQNVNISLTDLQGTNGVVHVVDEVLLP
jgi:transforming growth factor-beta-induced protein